MKKVVIIGAGESGTGAAILAKKQGFDVFLTDKSLIKENYKEALLLADIDFEEGQHDEARVLEADLVIKSPGVPDKVDLIQKIKAQGIPIIGEIEFASRYSNVPTIGITGSNGKTTTTLLTHHLLHSAGVRVEMGGNIGKSYAELVANEAPNLQWYVLELSSFQLDGIEKYSPDIAMLLNITPDHLDRYEYKFENYIASKFGILRGKAEQRLFIYNGDDENIMDYFNANLAKKWAYDPDFQNQPYEVKKGFYESGKFNIPGWKSFTFDLSKTSLKGQHNYFNAYCAVAAAMNSGLVTPQQVQSGLETFKNAPHRLETVATINGIEYINDSKATNVDSVFYALGAMTKPTVLILGGVDKGNDYSPLDTFVKAKVKAIVCMGIDNEKIKTHYGNHGFPIVESGSAAEAVQKATHLATEGDAVLLSPACASFDLFNNYEDRGEQFKACVLG
jgi:UDP-N-acetylmuramoylalanine--D-glutamate ligase